MGLHTEQRVCETCFDVVLAWLNQATAAPEDPSVASSDSAGSMLDRAASTESVRSEGGSPADRGGQSGGGFFRRALSKVEKADSKLLQKGIQFGRSVSTELVTRGEKVVEAGKIALEGTVALSARMAALRCAARAVHVLWAARMRRTACRRVGDPSGSSFVQAEGVRATEGIFESFQASRRITVEFERAG
jgi:hypothetical protein